MTLSSISIALPAPDANPGNCGTIGADALRLLGGLAIDFQAMRLEPLTRSASEMREARLNVSVHTASHV